MGSVGRKEAADRDRSRVLVVDDDADACDIATQVLRHLGRDPVCVQDAVDALRRIQGEPWDVILLDLVMPGLNGFDLLRAAHRTDRPAPPVIAVSSYGEFRREALNAGFAAFIDKPVELTKLQPLLAGLASNP